MNRWWCFEVKYQSLLVTGNSSNTNTTTLFPDSGKIYFKYIFKQHYCKVHTTVFKTSTTTGFYQYYPYKSRKLNENCATYHKRNSRGLGFLTLQTQTSDLYCSHKHRIYIADTTKFSDYLRSKGSELREKRTVLYISVVWYWHLVPKKPEKQLQRPAE